MAREGSTGPYRGFERMELSMHGLWATGIIRCGFGKTFPDETADSSRCSMRARGETGAPELKYNPVPREHYHTDGWADSQTIAFLDSLPMMEDWFVWMSFSRSASSMGSAGRGNAPYQVARSGIARRVIRARARRSKRSSHRSRIIGSIGMRAASATTKADPRPFRFRAQANA